MSELGSGGQAPGRPKTTSQRDGRELWPSAYEPEHAQKQRAGMWLLGLCGHYVQDRMDTKYSGSKTVPAALVSFAPCRKSMLDNAVWQFF